MTRDRFALSLLPCAAPALALLLALLLAAPPARALDVNVLEQAQLWGISADGIQGDPTFSLSYTPTQAIAPGLSFSASTTRNYSLDVTPSVAGMLGAPEGSLTRSFSDNILQPLAFGAVQEGVGLFQAGASVLDVTTDLAFGYATPGQALQTYGQAAWNVLPGTGFANFAADLGAASLSIQGSTPPPQGQTSFTQPDQPPCTFEFCF